MGISKSDIKDSVNLYEYIEAHYPEILFKKQGSVYKANCPFHNENTGSLVVWDNGTFKCFGCDESGDVFSFVALMEGLDVEDKNDFKEVCRIIANNLGMQFDEKATIDKYIKTKELMDSHTRRYWAHFTKSEDAKSYLNSRGITKETRNEFRLGYVPMDEYKTRKDIGNISGRLSFPILEHKSIKYAKCIAMGYRTLKDEEPKYLNDVNREGIFTKGETLYGFSQSLTEMRKKRSVHIVEGYMDVISLHQAGVKNTVAPLGTALTEMQIDVLIKYVDNIYLLLDPDSAGISAMLKTLPLLVEKGINVYMYTVENGKDPADICLEYEFCKEVIEAHYEEHKSLALKYFIDREFKTLENYIFREKLRIAKNVSKMIDNIQDPFEKDIYTDLLKNKVNRGV